MSTSTAILNSLNDDLALEHGAIIQYVIHGVQLREAGVTDPVRKMAREEMWHFEWLVEAIRDRGGEPGLDRADVFLSASVGESLREDVATEEMALEHYARTLALVGDSDPALTALINRIVADEKHHRASFGRLADQVAAAGDAAYAPHPLIGPEDLAVVGPTIAVEYATLLQYLFNKYGCGDCEQGEEYFEFAIDEMRHLGWAATYVPGAVPAPVAPLVPHDRVVFVRSAEEARIAAKTIEDRSAEFYSQEVGAATNPSLADDIARASEQHEYHRYKLGHEG